MDRWALEFAERAAFICVGCAGSSLASTFVRDLKLKHTSVTYCAGSDMPSWGQLGCGGFIVLDGAGKVAHAKTSAFMQVRDLAFRHVALPRLHPRTPTPPHTRGTLRRPRVSRRDEIL